MVLGLCRLSSHRLNKNIDSLVKLKTTTTTLVPVAGTGFNLKDWQVLSSLEHCLGENL